MYLTEDMFKNFLDGSNDEKVTAATEEYIAKLRQYQRELREMASKLSSLVPYTVVFDDAVGYIPEYRPPEEIKRDIKHEKNPMRLKQLNQELNESYKYYKRMKKND